MCARQNRETSRAQASCPCCWAEAAVAIRINGKTKRNLVIELCLTPEMNALARSRVHKSGRQRICSRMNRGVPERPGRRRLRRIAASAPGSKLLGCDLVAGLCGQIAVEHGAATARGVGGLLA